MYDEILFVIAGQQERLAMKTGMIIDGTADTFEVNRRDSRGYYPTM